MAEKIYFQWQNPVLLKTIYPKRDLKLRHFLLYYYEVDLWVKNRNKKIEDFAQEKAEFEKAQKKVISDAYNSEQKWRKYFDDSTQPSVPVTNSQAGKEEMARLKKLLFGLYDDFTLNFEKYAKEADESRDRKEKNFVAMRVTEWEGYCKGLTQEIAKRQSRLKDPNVTNPDIKSKELEDLKTVLSTMEAERDKLREFAAAQAKLEKRKEDFAKLVKENSKKEAEILHVLEPLQKQIETREAEREKLKAAIVRLTNPPKLEDVLNYFAQGDLYNKISKRFGEGKWKVGQPVIDEINRGVREAFGSVIESLQKEILPFIQKSDPNWLKQLIKNQNDKTRKAQKQLDKVILKLDSKINSLRISLEEKKKSMPEGATELRALEDEKRICQDASNILSGTGMKEILESEMNKLEDLQVAIEYLGQKDNAKWDEEKIKPQRSALEKCENDILKAKNKIQKDGLEEKLAPITSALDIDRETYLSEYVPDGPVTVKDIMLYLAEMENARLEKLNLDQLLYEVFQRFWKEPERFPLWLQYMVIHFSGMRYASAHDSWYDPRALLLDLQTMDIQEGLKNKDDDPSNDTNYDIDDLTDEQVLEKLKSYKKQLPLWMWKEIVEVTDLRLTEVTNPNEDWENLSPDEQKARNSARDKRTGQYLAIMEKWKKDNLTGWRKEHDRANRLIVTRAVCNEVAEHIQHLRGHEGAAGLAEKPGWYMGEEKKYYESKARSAGSRPYFVKAKDRNDFEVGASILWLRFVHEVPDQWRVAKPLATREGDGLIPEAYLGRSIDSGGWAYKMGGPIVRTRSKATTNNNNKKGSKGGKENQWLRWMHEATVVEVTENAETGDKDQVVLTFETTLPGDDPSISTIGLVKRYLSDLTRQQVEDSYNAAFVGFMPEAKLPADAAASLSSDLEEMLDWNHILQKEAVSAADLEAYRNNYIRNRKPSRPTIEIIDIAEREKGKADLPICDFVKWTDSLVTPTNNLWKVRIWGDKTLGLTVKNLATEADSNFQAVGVYVKETLQRGAVSNFLTIGRKDIDKLIAMQIEDEFKRKRAERKRSGRKRLEAWREQKMNWLCKGEGTIYFTKGGKGWETAQSILWGTVALGGNLVQVEGDPVPIVFKVEGGKKKEIMMAKLVGFSPSDWYRPLDELLAKGLVHRCFCAYQGDKPGDSPQGIVYSPFFSPRFWDFAGTAKPRAFYLPFDQLVKPGSDGYEEDVKKGYEGIAERLQCPDEQ